MSVVPLRPDKIDPHMTGPAKCLHCKHEWEAEAPLGTVGMECPSCSLMRGYFVAMPSYPDEEHYQCACGSQVFCVTRARVYCPNCGKNHKPWD